MAGRKPVADHNFRNPTARGVRLAHKASLTGDGLKVVWYGDVGNHRIYTVEKAVQWLERSPFVLFPGDAQSKIDFERMVEDGR